MTMNTHNHDTSAEAINFAKIQTRVKRRASETLEIPCQVSCVFKLAHLKILLLLATKLALFLTKVVFDPTRFSH